MSIIILMMKNEPNGGRSYSRDIINTILLLLVEKIKEKQLPYFIVIEKLNYRLWNVKRRTVGLRVILRKTFR